MDAYKVEKAELDALERVVGDRGAEPIAVTFSALRHITNDFSRETEIGRGGFAVVYLGTLPNGSRIAVKKFLESLTIDDSAFRDEVEITSKAAHKNVVRLIGYCCHTDEQRFKIEGRHIWAENRKRLICLEYVPNGTLRNRITDTFYGAHEWNRSSKILKGICQALRYLHDEVRVIHGDIKPENVMLEDNFVPKVLDFGISVCVEEGEDYFHRDCIMGTGGYMAPENFETYRSSFKSDIYSLGIMIAELLTGSKGYIDAEQVLKTLSGELVVAHSQSRDIYQEILKWVKIGNDCMELDPDRRPTAFEIIQMVDETENSDDSVTSSGHTLPLQQFADLEYDSQDMDSIESAKTTTDFAPSEEEPASLGTNGETNTHEDDKPDLVSELSTSVDLSDLRFLEKITNMFSLENLCGNGGIRGDKAFVYKGIISDEKTIAVKRFIGVGAEPKTFEEEAKQLMRLDHENIVRLLGYCHDESRGYKLVHYKGEKTRQDIGKQPEQLLCYEYMHKGSLHEHLTGQGHPVPDWTMRYELIKGTCEGLNHLHTGLGDCRIVHLNLTPSNVLLDQNYKPHITGFDISRIIGEDRANTVIHDLKRQIRYLPPDFLNPKNDTAKTDLTKVDIYSLGLMILEIATRQEIDKQESFIYSVRDKWREEPQIASLYPALEPDKLWQVKLCIDIGLDCVKPLPQNRPTANTIIERLKNGIRPELVPDSRPGVHTNLTHADDRTQVLETATRWSWRACFSRCNPK